MTLVDVLGDVGGLVEIIFFLAIAMIKPISYHSYILKLTQKLFTARTKNSELFQHPKHKLKGEVLDKQLQISALIGHYFRRNKLG
jgi:hypothetical protein